MDEGSSRYGQRRRGAWRAAAVATLVTPLFACIGVAAAAASGDTVPPSLVEEQFTPTTIDTASDTSVAVTVHATDDLAGTDDVEACLQSPSGDQTYCGVATVPVTGSALDGTFALTVAFPAHREIGSWTLGHILLHDADGNVRFVYAAELDARGLPIALRVDDGPSLPEAPTAAYATAADRQATLTWLAPSFDGGSPIIGYTITPFIGAVAQPEQTFSGTGTSQTFTGLVNGTTYTFQVAAVTNKGTGPASSPTNAVTPATVPGPPGIGAATRGNGDASLWWTAPASDGGVPITGYTVTPYIGAVAQPVRTFLSTATTQVISGLTNDTTYSFRVAAVNAVGTGTQSAASNTVVPGNRPPQASAGVDQTVHSLADFTLNGTGSSDPDGDPLRYSWARIQGAQATIRNASSATTTVAGIKGPATVVFRLTVTDPLGHTSTDDVTVTISSK